MFNKLYRVSVIIPVYNAASSINKAVESVLSIPDAGEVLLIDDGSKDNSFEICNQLAKTHKKVKLLSHKERANKGAAASRNLGIINAKYDFIAFLDADDYYLPNRFENEKKVFSEIKDADGVYGCNQEVFETEHARKLYFSKRSTELTCITEKVSPEDLYKCMLFGGYGEFHTSTITLKKDVFKKTGLFNTSIRYVEDTELWLKLAVSCRLYNGSINEPQTIRVVHEKNSIHDWDLIKPYKDLMYQSLFDWIVKQPVAFSTKNDFFTALYYHFNERYKSSASLLWKQLKHHPDLLFSSFLYKKLYILFKS